ncbi:hypothetical protein DFR50_12744 [Roseiarcus fermentans]|uniref:PsiF repeat-containing protein n=1 Tax=Roseiarcus fermentans TaxID=1473586 RepID=A0A366F0Y6_9HYPH|nr:hypothetical protein [Roseiarcus fermentans]RBP07399.1 hypothetical protein DFR50_12744 [Roseiarcus fermentans]
MRAAVAFLALWACLTGPARADDDPACAKFEEPLAYNACLASRGPKANAVGKASGAPVRARADPEAEAPAMAKKPSRSQTVRRRGRVHMEFFLR